MSALLQHQGIALQEHTILTNVPYGRQSKRVGKISESSLGRTYSKFGLLASKLVREGKVKDVFVVAPKTKQRFSFE